VRLSKLSREGVGRRALRRGEPGGQTTTGARQINTATLMLDAKEVLVAGRCDPPLAGEIDAVFEVRGDLKPDSDLLEQDRTP